MALSGYRNLAWLKARLLPADMGDDSDFDVDLAEIGKGVAAQFDAFTGRTLRRTVGAVYETPADRESLVVTCYPIETITALQLVTQDVAADILTSVTGKHPRAGIVRFGGEPGTADQLIRVTSTGAYWCEDDDTLPTGGYALPDDILQAWVQQCRAVCEAENTFRTKGAQKPDPKSPSGVPALTLLPGVRSILQFHIRLG